MVTQELETDLQTRQVEKVSRKSVGTCLDRAHTSFAAHPEDLLSGTNADSSSRVKPQVRHPGCARNRPGRLPCL